MCAITGLFDAGNASSEAVLKKMTDTMIHRGPDGGRQVFFEVDDVQIGLGHRRLAIIDLSEGGTQPMQFAPYWICFNGEIYNYQSVKEELIQLGHQFQSHSDTEMILHAYAQWGKSCVERFRGMFAFVIVNTETGAVFCVRDRAGVKPFYFYLNDGLFLFSSELKAFHEHPSFRKAINLSAVEMFMQFGNIPAPHTIFQSAFKLKPGHYLEFNLSELKDRPAYLNQHQYWNVYDSYNQPKADLSFEDAKKQTETILRESCELRMVADVPVGVFLSGGFDSAAVTSLLQTGRTQKLKTYTIAVPDIGLNEAPYAKDVAKYLGTEHTEFECSHQEAIDLIDDLPFYYDEPFGDSSAIPTGLVSKIARQHVTVALSADAGDEVFAGYNRYDYLIRYGQKLNQLPAFARKTAAGMMNLIEADSIPYLRNKYNFANRYEKLKNLLKDPSPEQMMWSLSSQFDNEGLNRLLKSRKPLPPLAYNSKELSTETYSPLSYMMAVDYQTYLPDDILTKVDRATMRFSLEGREPFLDHKVIEWAAQLPDHFKYNEGIKKYILKEIVYQYIPRELMDRPKMGFAIPFEKWMMEDLRSRLEDFLSDERIARQGIFHVEEIRNIRSQFLNGKKELGLKVWYLLMFQMWYERWMN